MALTQLTPQYSSANVLTGQMNMFYYPVTTNSVAAALPADTLAVGADWGDPWLTIGATESGTTLSIKRSTDSINIEEQITNVDMPTKSMSFELDVELSEDTFTAMQLAFGGSTVTSVAASGTGIGSNTMTINTPISYYVVGFESINQFGYWRRMVIPRCVSIANTKTAYQRSKKQRTYTVAIQNLCAPEEVLYKEMTAEKTS